MKLIKIWQAVSEGNEGELGYFGAFRSREQADRAFSGWDRVDGISHPAPKETEVLCLDDGTIRFLEPGIYHIIEPDDAEAKESALAKLSDREKRLLGLT